MICSLGILSLFIAFKFAKCGLEPFITGGEKARHNQYPHSVYLNMRCVDRTICGGSVLTQNVVLTAAHCMVGCEGMSHEDVEIRYGHENIQRMETTYLQTFVHHDLFDETLLKNDLCLLLTMRRIPLSSAVKRVILMSSPPKVKYGFIAGWGNDEYGHMKEALRHTKAKIQNARVCSQMGWLPHGTFCAGPTTGLGAPHAGDSGSALIVDDCIQIGLVSFKVDEYSLVAYTNVSHHLPWILRSSKRLYCD